MSLSKICVVAAVVLCAASILCLAGEVFGKIVVGDVAVGEGTAVTVQCGDKAYPPVKTDKTGNYHVVVKEAGKCTLGVQHDGQTASIAIVSFDDAVQYDLVLEKKDGKLSVRRK